MKKTAHYLLGFIAVASIYILSSCEGEGGTPKAPPSINVSILNPKEAYEVGEEVPVRAEFVTESGLVLMSYFPVVNGTAGTIVEINTFAVGLGNSKGGSHDIKFEIESAYEGKTIKVEVVIQDGQGGITKDDVEIIVVAP